MRNGFSFKGKHSSEFPYITVKTKDRPIMPAVKAASYAADNMNGEYDFTDYTGQTYYEKRTIQLEIAVLGDNLRDLQQKLNNLSVWLSGKGDIIFDDMPNVKFTGRVNDSIPYMPEHGGHKAMLAVSFLCEPFSEGLWDVFDGPTLDATIPLDSNIMIGADEYLTLAAGTHVIDCTSDVPIEPIIRVPSGTRTIEVKNDLGVKSITVDYASGEYLIDCKKKQVYSKTENNATENLMPYVSGDFPTLTPSGNNIRTTDVIEVHYVPQYFYNGGIG